MLEFKRGNLFESDAEALINAVNTVGVMGKGIALQFSRQFPEIMPIYEEACRNGTLTVGKVQTIRLSLLEKISGPRFIINFPTKKHWKGDSKIEYIDSGLLSLRNEIKIHGIHSVAVPPLGCGLGGLEWSDVRTKIAESLGDLEDLRVLVYEPVGMPDIRVRKTVPLNPE